MNVIDYGQYTAPIRSNYATIGTCSLCGGEVLAFVGPWLGTSPPEPQCSGCGAHPARPDPVRPVIPMERRPAPKTTISIRELGMDEFSRRLVDLSHLTGLMTGDGFDRAFGST